MASKSIYIAGKLGQGEESMQHLAADLETRGHTVLQKWWEQGQLPVPYLDNPERSRPAAEAMIRAATESDVFILMPTDNMLGAAVELGAAIASAEENPEKHVIVVNPFETRQSVFYAHPAVVALKGLKDIQSQGWY